MDPPSSQSAWLSEVPICHLFGRFLSAIPSTKSTKAWDFLKVFEGDEALKLPLSFFKRMEDELEVFKMQDFLRF